MNTSSEPVHFHSADSRFCGAGERLRRFSMDECAVTCPACQSRDTLTLSEQGRAYVESLGVA